MVCELYINLKEEYKNMTYKALGMNFMHIIPQKEQN